MKKFLSLCLIAFSFIVGFYACTSGTSSTIDTATEQVSTAPQQDADEGNTWEIDSVVDKMTDKVVHLYRLNSDNMVTQDEVYGETAGEILIRDNGKKDVMFMIGNGQILGNDFDGTNYVKIRFDDGKAERYTFAESSDMDNSVIFINAVGKFIEKAKKAKKILVEVTLFDAGTRVFEFTTKEPLSI